MTRRIEQIASDLQRSANDARRAFGSLSIEQLNWQPAPESWSVAQCFDHLIVTHGRFLPVLARYRNGPVPASFWERYSPLSRFFGRFLIRSLQPDNPKKIKTTSRGQPSISAIDTGIIDRYCEHQEILNEHVKDLPSDINLKKTIITSPMLAFFTYSLDDWLTIAVIHCQRHHLQAKRVTEAADFPSA